MPSRSKRDETSSSQAQRSGSGSSNQQAGRDVTVINNHISITVAATELQESRAAVLEGYFGTQAAAVGDARLAEFDPLVIERLATLKALDAVGDPAFQKILRQARLTAASSGERADYDLLVELLAVRAEGENRLRSAAVARAIEIVDDLDDAALLGLTVFWAGSRFSPRVGPILDGLQAWDDRLSKFELEKLPAGSRWLEHLHILGAVRLDGSFTKRSFPDVLTTRVPAYVAGGITEEQLEEAQTRVREFGRGQFAYEEHPLVPGMFRLAYHSYDALKEGVEREEDDPDVVRAVLELAENPGGLTNFNPDVRDALLEKIEEFPAIHAYRTWWDQVPQAVVWTHVGRALAVSNLLKYHPDMSDDLNYLLN